MLILLFFASILSAGSYFLVRKEPTLRTLSIAWSTLIAVLTGIVTVPVLVNGVSYSSGMWHVDAFAALLMILVGFIQWTATLVSAPYIKEELHEKVVTFTQARLYHALLQLFVLSMMFALAADNIGIMWIALEGTTLTTTMLVAFYTHGGSLEAAWKYIVLCSIGISLGLLGVLLVFHASSITGLDTDAALSWTTLRSVAHGFSPQVMRLAFAFIFIGYGAKVGFVPMHTWLPDAHGRTPSPISGMLSGVLLSVALYAILRFKGLTDLALGSSAWTNQFFLIFGALSFILPAAFILVQRNYKRLLAYSSIEHMGFIAFCIGLGAPGLIAAVAHLIGHAIAKSMLFFGTGNILLRWKSTKIERIGPVMTSLPYTGSLFTLGLLTLLAVPPSPLFMSEILAFAAAMNTHPWLSAAMLLAGTVIFAGMIRNLVPMIFGKREDHVTAPVERWNLSHSAMLLHLLLLIALGLVFFTPAGQATLASIAASII